MDRGRYDHHEIVGRADPQMSIAGGAAGVTSEASAWLGEAELDFALTNLEAAVSELARQAKTFTEAADQRSARIDAMLAKVDESMAWLADA